VELANTLGTWQESLRGGSAQCKISTVTVLHRITSVFWLEFEPTIPFGGRAYTNSARCRRGNWKAEVPLRMIQYAQSIWVLNAFRGQYMRWHHLDEFISTENVVRHSSLILQKESCYVGPLSPRHGTSSGCG